MAGRKLDLPDDLLSSKPSDQSWTFPKGAKQIFYLNFFLLFLSVFSIYEFDLMDSNVQWLMLG